MTPVLPELRRLPAGVVLDGELVAWKGRDLGFITLTAATEIASEYGAEVDTLTARRATSGTPEPV